MVAVLVVITHFIILHIISQYIASICDYSHVKIGKIKEIIYTEWRLQIRMDLGILG